MWEKENFKAGMWDKNIYHNIISVEGRIQDRMATCWKVSSTQDQDHTTEEPLYSFLKRPWSLSSSISYAL